jgi:hypothetical protein
VKEDKDKKTEYWLKEFTFKPVPSGLKEKILHSISHKKRSFPVITPWLGKGFVATLILLIIVITVDATVSSTQINRLSSILGIPQEPASQQEEEWSMLKDIIWEPLDPSENNARKKFYTLGEDNQINKRQPEWREILEEEFESHENTKNFP